MEETPCKYLFLITIIFILTICVFNVPFAIVENNNCKTYPSIVSNHPSKTYYIPGKGLCPSKSKFSTTNENVTYANLTTVSSLATSSGGARSSTTRSSTLIIVYSRDNDDDDSIVKNIDYMNCKAISGASHPNYVYAMICLSYTFFYIFVYICVETYVVFGTKTFINYYLYYDHNMSIRIKKLYLFYFVLFSVGLIVWNFAFIFGADYWEKSDCKSYMSDGYNIHIANSIFMFFLCIYSFISYQGVYIPEVLPTSVDAQNIGEANIRQQAPPITVRQPETNVFEMNHIQRRIGAETVVLAVLSQPVAAQVDVTLSAAPKN